MSWADPGNSAITKYQVQRKAGGGAYGGWTDISGSDADTTSHTVTGLTNGTAYGFRIRAVAGTTNGAQSDEATATPARADGTNPTGTVIATLTPPATVTANTVNTFTAPVNTVLDASTTYWLQAEGAVTDTTTSNSESGATGWSIADGGRFLDSNNWVSSSLRHRFAIKGTVNPPPDTTAPTVVDIEYQTPSGSPTNADSLKWRVTFSEPVDGVAAADFSISGSTAGLSVAAVSPDGNGFAASWDVTASGGNLAGVSGNVSLGFANGHDIRDAADNQLVSAGTTPNGTDERTWVVDNTAPTLSIGGLGASISG
ncbi:fibronectin type III domain-containing protein, partial [Candidatus Synechococcus spongiarum]|uniref:fibronectin type III domain-containing protein n=1 Tax=Candidatus Synechococcus spongiarum TaxID=431041 RepID=UPI0013784683